MEIIRRLARYIIRDEIVALNNRIKRLIAESQDYLYLSQSVMTDLRTATEVISQLKAQDPIARSLDQNRHRSSQQRIRDLERDVEYLRKRLNEALSPKQKS